MDDMAGAVPIGKHLALHRTDLAPQRYDAAGADRRPADCPEDADDGSNDEQQCKKRPWPRRVGRHRTEVRHDPPASTIPACKIADVWRVRGQQAFVLMAQSC